MTDLTNALATANLPTSFWPPVNNGWQVGIYRLEWWARMQLATRAAGDHFDAVACPNPGMVPQGGADDYTGMPEANPPSGTPVWIWIFWDTVPDPPNNALPPIVGQAFDEMRLPSPAIGMSPSTIDGIADATVVNLPTWLWIDPAAWHTVVARAAGGGLTATVWATPEKVTWTSDWDFTNPAANPEGGVNQQPTVLDLKCTGPGTPYSSAYPASSSSPDCGTTFTQSTFGARVPLTATIDWSITWALTDAAGVVGGEGDLKAQTTASTIPLRTLQIESVITSG